jgi:membrane AbrB-like protein
MTEPAKSRSFPKEDPLYSQLLTIAVAGVGGAACAYAQVPAGYMSGAMAMTAVFAMTGYGAQIGLALRLIAMLLSGISIGSAVTPETLHNVVTYPVSVSAMLVCVVLMTATSSFVLSRFAHWDKSTAFLAAVPGAMSYILSIIPNLKANAPRVAITQMIRALILMGLVPLFVAETGYHLAGLGTRPTDPLDVFLGLIISGGALGYILHKKRFGGGMLLGSMLISGLIHATGYASGRAPDGAMISGQILIGAWAGSRFVGFDWRNFIASSPAMLGSVSISIIFSALFAAGAAQMLGVAFGATFLAYAPGGFEAMTVLAVALGFDPLFVAAHHLARYFLLNIGLPLYLRYIMKMQLTPPPQN